MNNLNLQPKKVFHYFGEIAAIPHGSGNTKAISDYLAAFAKEHKLEYYQDDLNNIVIIKEAAAGYEHADAIIIQGHMDMVCEKESDCSIDFEKDGLDLYVDGDFLKARGTTLGGDDGIAVAYILAIMDSPEIAHPRLEAVITVDEETGMSGAKGIDLSMLKGKKMLNIDSDIEGHFLTSCAGGMTTRTFLPVQYETAEGLFVSLKVTGLEGGHSGSEIDKEHANANIVMGRVLKAILDEMPFGLTALGGGLKDNAIPRECTAEFLIDAGDKERLKDIVSSLESVLKKEFCISDKNIALDLCFGEMEQKQALTLASLTKIIFYLRNVPNGVQNMSRVMPGLVETSLNAGIMNLTEENFCITASVRSSVSTRKADLRDKLELLTNFLGGTFFVNGEYPAWEYTQNSEIRETIRSVYNDLFHEEPVFEAIHAGLECGILSGKIENLDCVSFGPNNYDIHTPKERLSISSTERVWNLLIEFLKRCK